MTAKLNFRSVLFLLLPALFLTFSCKDENLDIQDSKDRLDVLEGTTIKSINEQIFAINTSISDLEETDKALDAYIKELEAGLSATNDTLTKLKHADEALDKKITDLQTYVDTELTTITDWADATFVTIEQYSVVQTEISAIKTLIDKTKSDITEEYTTAIETAISNSETGMKEWVNSELTKSYYTISDIDGKISAIEALFSDGDTNLQNQINEQKAALQQAKADLTNEYKQYINQAIASGGIIDQAIATQVKKAQDELQSKIDAINERLDALEDRLGKLEDDFVNRIQSLKYIPEYSDRKVKISDEFKTVTLNFLVSPSNQAVAIQDAWKSKQDVVTGYLRYTQNPATRAISPAVPLVVTSVVGKDDGTLNVILKEDNSNPIDPDFFEGNNDAIVYIKLSDGVSDVYSDFVDAICFVDDFSHVDDWTLFVDLSPIKNGEYQTSNCYIVSESGYYMFKAYKGNSQELAGFKHFDHPEGVPTMAEVLWESFGTTVAPSKGELIQRVGYSGENIVFQIPNKFAEGNAVIALKGEDGTILWSWHIWLTAAEMKEITYANGAGVMMDRNLGALSADVNDPMALGLFYQWGRKDPFLGSASIQGSRYAVSTRNLKVATNTAETSTIGFATANPHKFILQNDSGDWLAVQDNTLWSSNKTIYDPCPAGWKIPEGGYNGGMGEQGLEDGIWAKAGIPSKGYYHFADMDSGKNGKIFTSPYCTPDTWYPAAGSIKATTGELCDPGTDGIYMSSTTFGDSDPCFTGLIIQYYPHECLHYINCGGERVNRAGGCSVRCQKE